MSFNDPRFEFVAPQIQEFENEEFEDLLLANNEQEPPNLRLGKRSLSVGNLVMFSEQQHRLMDTVNEENTVRSRNNLASGNLYAGLSSASSEANSSKVDIWNKLAQPKTQSQKFISQAEEVRNFQVRTPIRFRTTKESSCSQIQQFHRLDPKSPALQAKNRNRPIYIMSQEEKERLEAEKMKNYKIKALPLNKRILEEPAALKVVVEKKPPTIPQPFKLTAVPSKTKVSSTKKPLLQQNPQHITNNSDGKKVTKLMPFSFLDRDKSIQSKKEAFIQKYLDEERRAREFHAKPVPKNLHLARSTRGSTNSLTSSEKEKITAGPSSVPQFRARPATVLKKQPFIPGKATKPATEPAPFKLETQKRIQERELFEQQLNAKKEENERIRKQQEDEQRRMEQNEIEQIRREMEHKANAIRKYKPLNIQPSGKVTVPISPKFHSTSIQVRSTNNKENISNNN